MRILPIISLFCLVSVLFSCKSYQAFESRYNFSNPTGEPDYSSLDYWAAHPWKWDPSDSVPSPLRGMRKDSLVDVFFLHPTSLTRKSFSKYPNAQIDDKQINAKTDYSSILYQASVFNHECRVFAPRYRQAHIRNFFIRDSSRAAASFEIAYQDIKKAFEYYLANFNGGRPIIIASHSQGTKMAERLLKEYFEGSILTNRLVVAYLAGWPVPKDYFSALKMCTDSLQTGCLCSWRTVRKGYIPRYVKKEKGNSYATNPLNWTIGEEHASRKLNKGSVLTRFNKIYKETTDAQVKHGLLFVRRPKFPWSFLYFTRNYHVGDINLFYLNLRENISRRIGMYWKQ